MGIKSIVGMGLAAVGAVYATGKMASMDSEDIRDIGSNVKDFVQECGEKMSGSEIGQSIQAKAAELPYGLTVISAAGKGISSGLDGFERFMGAIADAREKSEMDGSDFAGNLADGMSSSLKGLVASTGDFVAEKLGFGDAEHGVPASAEIERDDEHAVEEMSMDI